MGHAEVMGAAGAMLKEDSKGEQAGVRGGLGEGKTRHSKSTPLGA